MVHPMNVFDEETKDSAFKVVIAGNAGVGKTTLLKAFFKEFQFMEEHPAEKDVYFKNFTLDNGKKVQLEFWDMPSLQSDLKTVNKLHFRRAVGAVIVFDVTNAQTFKDSIKWINITKENAENNCQIILVGNKTDICLPTNLSDQAEVRNDRFATQHSSSEDKTNGSKETGSEEQHQSEPDNMLSQRTGQSEFDRID